MMRSMFLPLIVAATLGAAVTMTHRRLPPRIASRAIAASIVVIAAAAVPSIWLVSITYLAHLSVLGGRFEWCAHALGMHDPIPWFVGLPAMTTLAVGIHRTRTVFREYRCLRHDVPGAVEIADCPRPFAFTLPGRGGRVVVSSGLVDMLDQTEQAVVLAHERAHALYRHDRYLLAAQLASANVPVLRPLAGRLQFSLERWADEAAVEHCDDRPLVARTLGKVALRSAKPVAVMSFAGLGVPARVAALLAPPMTPLHRASHTALWISIGLAAALAGYQLHHLAGLVASLCPG
jgi:hypothetical protein